MSTANYSVSALYGYDSSIFDGLTVPATIDKDKVVSKILMESAPFALSCQYCFHASEYSWRVEILCVSL